MSNHLVLRIKKTVIIKYNCYFKRVDQEYEVYVAAVNDHGVGEPSTRVIFSTPSEKVEESSSSGGYNVTACCNTVGIRSECMPLCDYSAKLSDLKSLTQKCTKDFPKVVKFEMLL